METTYQLKIKSLNKDAIQLYLKTLKKLFNKFDLNYTQFRLPTTRKRITLLKSPHVNKSGGGGAVININIAKIERDADFNQLKPMIQRWILEANSRRGMI